MKEPLSSKSLQSTPWKMPNHLSIGSAVSLKNVETIEHGLSGFCKQICNAIRVYFLFKINFFSVYEFNMFKKRPQPIVKQVSK